MKSYKTVALILCAGKGERTGLNYNKIFYTLPEGRTVIERVIDLFSSSVCTDILLVINKNDEQKIKELYGGKYVFGGSTRGESVLNGLKLIKNEGGCDTVVIHDCARPYPSIKLINDCVKSAELYGSGVAAVTPTDTVKLRDGDKISCHLDRSKLINVHTPQAFDFNKLYGAYLKQGVNATDDSQVFAEVMTPVLVEGEYKNRKITTADDLSLKVGNGFDVHPLSIGRRLILGGVEIPFEKGLMGHSDADALLHAITDAVLSAAGLADIGALFPDSDDSYKGISSAILLKRALDFAAKRGYNPVNVSAVIMAEKPRLSPFIGEIRKSISQICGLSVEDVNVSATTTEGLGIVGEGKGIAASALCLMKRL